MANIFADGEELLNKKDFDKKVNIANSIGNDLDYKSLVASANWSDIFGVNTGTDWSTRLNLLRIAQTNQSKFFFGSGDTKGGLEVGYTDHVATIIGGNNPNIVWSESVAWKSDIAKLEQEIADLKKQNGGVRQSANPLVSMLYVPSFEMEVA